MGGRRAASWALAVLAAIALAASALLLYAGHVLFDSGAFTDRVDASLRTAPVRDAAARRLTDGVIAVKPDLVALRPIIELGARGVVATEPFRALVRAAALNAHRAAFDREQDTVSVRVRDAGVLLAAAVRRLRPDAAARIPEAATVRVARIQGGVQGFMLSVAEASERARAAWPIALAVGLALVLAALVVSESRRAALLRLGAAASGAGGLVALGAALAPGLVADQVGGANADAGRAVAGVWLDPIVPWALAVAVVGALVALAAASVVRPVDWRALARRGRSAVTASPRNAGERAVRILVVLAAGAAMVAWPRIVLTVAVAAIGIVLVLVAFAELLAMAAGDAPQPRARDRRVRRGARVGAVLAIAVASAVAVAAIAADDEAGVGRVGRCNGHAPLCDRRLDEVAFLGTHNSMAAAGERGWLFASQDAGIPRQLNDGVRALLIDTHYGFPTAHGVLTDLSGESKSRSKLEAGLSPQFVATAERARDRIGRAPAGKRAVFLCHAFCEVGATRAVQALTAVHRFLVTHPEEVLILSIEDDTSAADTAATIRASGLVDEVYRGSVKPPWPTLGELIDRDERVLVLAEEHAGGAPWIHHQPVVMQETPFHFTSAAQLAAPASCKPNRGGTEGSLLLVNHWVDTSPAPRPTNAREVNARAFLTRRLDTCRSMRHKLPNVVAVDFYRQGDPLATVDALNGVG
jgi:hypothetical protein